MADGADHDSRLGMYVTTSTKGMGTVPSNVDRSIERKSHNNSGQRSPMAIHRTPSQLSKHHALRKLTNSLFEESSSNLPDQGYNVILEQEEDKEQQDQD